MAKHISQACFLSKKHFTQSKQQFSFAAIL